MVSPKSQLGCDVMRVGWKLRGLLWNSVKCLRIFQSNRLKSVSKCTKCWLVFYGNLFHRQRSWDRWRCGGTLRRCLLPWNLWPCITAPCCFIRALHEVSFLFSFRQDCIQMNPLTCLPFCRVCLQYSFSKRLILIVSSVSSSSGKILFRRSHVRDVAMKRLRFIDDYCRVRQMWLQTSITSPCLLRGTLGNLSLWKVRRLWPTLWFHLLKTWDGQELRIAPTVSDIWNLSARTLEGFLIRKITWPSSAPVIQTFISNRCWRNAFMPSHPCLKIPCRVLNICSLMGDWTSFLSSHFCISPKFRSFPLLRLPRFLPFCSHKAILH